MANEFYYCVSLSIVHTSVDPKTISSALSSLHLKIETMAGSERRRSDGKLIEPQRKAILSHWLADLHEEKRLFSGDIPISTFILGELERLEIHADLIAELRQDGDVALRIGWFSESNYSAAIFDANMVKRCGALGLDIELNCYGPSAPAAPAPDT